ncbi:MAG TPA: hypothetical protein ENJ24_05435 [Gammaproteobacteria bacterium]|nr:hypothetical protein [Gammaproteobacteria bacterium]
MKGAGWYFQITLLLLTFLLAAELQAAELIRFDQYPRQEFFPARGEKFKIPFVLAGKAAVSIDLLSPDGEIIRRLRSGKPLDKGRHMLEWDGRDSDGTIVPNEAWIPVLHARAGERTVTVDPRDTSGGEIVGVKLQKNDHRSYRYHLPVAARVSIRAGIDGGPLLKVLADWEPHAAGNNILYWNGFDADGLIDIRASGRQKLVIAAYRLPDYSIITSGNGKLDYRNWFQKKGWQLRPVNLADVPLQRGKEALSRHYYIPLLMNKSPRVSLRFKENLPLSDAGNPVVGEHVTIQVGMDNDSKWALQESRYEVGFFVDNTFVSEEEQGYVPLTWRWKPNNLAPGVHVLTVNISGFRGQVGVKSLRFEILSRGKKGNAE